MIGLLKPHLVVNNFFVEHHKRLPRFLASCHKSFQVAAAHYRVEAVLVQIYYIRLAITPAHTVECRTQQRIAKTSIIGMIINKQSPHKHKNNFHIEQNREQGGSQNKKFIPTVKLDKISCFSLYFYCFSINTHYLCIIDKQ